MSTFWQIVVPILAFGVGLLIGWLLWRWRRKTLTVEQWTMTESRTNEAEAQVIDLRDQRDGLVKEVTSLTSDLSSSRTRLTEIERLEASASGKVHTLEREVGSHEERVAELSRALQMSEEARAGLKSDLDGRTSTVQRLTAELDTARTEAALVPELRDQLEGTGADLRAAQAELGAATTQLETATSQLESTESQLASANARVSELVADVDVARAEAQAAQQSTSELEARLETADARISALTAAAGRAGDADARVREPEARIGGVEDTNRQLEAEEPASMLPQPASTLPQPASTLPQPASTLPQPASWRRGLTSLGTPGADHRDDLKVINGIGPKMEGVLNELGITAWEQVAALTPDEIVGVTEAIATFPGRIERDGWVGQAADLVRRFPDPTNRPTRETYLNRSADTDPWS